MNILFLSKEYPPETGWGGIGTYVYNIAHALSDKGHSVHVITLSYDRRDADPYKQVLRPVATLSDRRDARPIYDRQGDYSAHNGNIHVHRIRPLRFPTPVLNNFLFKSLEILKFNIAVILKIWEIVKKEKIDIIEAPEWRSEAFLLSFLKPGRIPLVIKCHSPSILLNEIYNPPIPPLNKGGDRRIDSRFVEWMEKITVRNADLVVSPSNNLANIISEKMGVKRENIKIMPNPIDAETFSPVNWQGASLPLQAVSRGGKGQGGKKVLFVGRLDRLKGAHIFAEAIPIILKDAPDASFVMAGRDTDTGPDNSSMKSYIKNFILQEIQSKIIFTGNVERTALVDYYRESDVCVVPSFYENFPNTVLEAMSCGKAVVASNAGGMPEVIEDSITGLLAKTGDARDFAEKIIRLLKDDTLRSQIGANARKRIEDRYSKDVAARDAEAVYRKLKNAK